MVKQKNSFEVNIRRYALNNEILSFRKGEKMTSLDPNSPPPGNLGVIKGPSISPRYENIVPTTSITYK